MPTLEQVPHRRPDHLLSGSQHFRDPLALVGYLRAKQNERRAKREYKTYDELDNKLLEYQKLALQHGPGIDRRARSQPPLWPAIGLRRKQQTGHLRPWLSRSFSGLT